MPTPSISVVVPAYNAAEWLPNLFDSLDGSKSPGVEVILVDDGSTDLTGEILDAYSATRPGVRVIHRKNGGAGIARNTGVDAASGEYVAFVDADDAFAPDHLGTLHDLARRHDLDLAMGNGRRFHGTPGDSDEAVIGVPKPEGVMTGVDWFDACMRGGGFYPFVWLTLVRRGFLVRHAIRFSRIWWIEDIVWMAEVLTRAGRVAYTPKESYYWRRTPGSTSDKSYHGLARRHASFIEAIEHLWDLARDAPPRESALLTRLASELGRSMLRIHKELDSFSARARLSRSLMDRGMLTRLLRDTATIRRKKRILRAYAFALFGTFLPDDGRSGASP